MKSLRIIKKDRELWDDIAQTYSNGVFNLKNNDEWYKSELIPKMLSLVPKKSTVLDFGCGHAYLSSRLKNKDCNVTGLDFSKKMVEFAKKKFPSLHLLSGDITKGHLKLGKYDYVTANLVFHDIPNLEEVIKKLASVVNTNGQIIFSIPHPCFFTKTGKRYFDGKDRILSTKLYKSKHSFYYFDEISKYGVRSYHRPLEFYLNLFFKHNFNLICFDEVFGRTRKNEIPFAVIMAFQKISKPR